MEEQLAQLNEELIQLKNKQEAKRKAQREANKRYQEANREKYLKYRADYYRKRRHEDPVFREKQYLSNKNSILRKKQLQEEGQQAPVVEV